MHHSKNNGLNICCISLKYGKPDIFSELVAFGSECEKIGHKVKYIFSKHCEWLVKDFNQQLNVEYVGESADMVSMVLDYLKFNTIEKREIKRIFKNKKNDIVFFGNMHPANKMMAKIAKQSGCKEIWWWLHEPYREHKKRYGRLKRLYYILAEAFQPGFLKLVDKIILSSKNARSVFSRRYPNYKGKIIESPLIFVDYFQPHLAPKPIYATFLGSAVASKGIDFFFDLVEYASIKNSALKFQIITNNKIKRLIRKIKNRNLKNLNIINDNYISELQIGKALKQSIVVLTPYKQTMQSGVVPVAYMHGVPVISTAVGSMPEFIINGKTGYLLPLTATLDDWLSCIKKISKNRTYHSKKCRQLYEKKHSPHNWSNFFPQLLEL